MLTGTVISSDTNMSHKYSLQRISWSQPEKQHWNPAKTTARLRTVDQNLYAIWHLVESMKISSSGVKGQHERSTEASKQRHHDNLNLHSAKDQCTCWRLLTGIQNSSCPFLFSESGARGGEQQRVMQFKKVTVFLHCSRPQRAFCHISLLGKVAATLSHQHWVKDAFCSIWCCLMSVEMGKSQEFKKKSTSLKMARHCFQIL